MPNITASNSTAEGKQEIVVRPALHEACMTGDFKTVAKLVASPDDSFDINAVDNHGISPLYYAFANGHTDIFEYLILHRANTDTVGNVKNCEESTLRILRGDKAAEAIIAKAKAEQTSIRTVYGRRIPLAAPTRFDVIDEDQAKQMIELAIACGLATDELFDERNALVRKLTIALQEKSTLLERQLYLKEHGITLDAELVSLIFEGKVPVYKDMLTMAEQRQGLEIEKLAQAALQPSRINASRPKKNNLFSKKPAHAQQQTEELYRLLITHLTTAFSNGDTKQILQYPLHVTTETADNLAEVVNKAFPNKYKDSIPNRVVKTAVDTFAHTYKKAQFKEASRIRRSSSENVKYETQAQGYLAELPTSTDIDNFAKSIAEAMMCGKTAADLKAADLAYLSKDAIAHFMSDTSVLRDKITHEAQDLQTAYINGMVKHATNQDVINRDRVVRHRLFTDKKASKNEKQRAELQQVVFEKLQQQFNNNGETALAHSLANITQEQAENLGAKIGETIEQKFEKTDLDSAVSTAVKVFKQEAKTSVRADKGKKPSHHTLKNRLHRNTNTITNPEKASDSEFSPRSTSDASASASAGTVKLSEPQSVTSAPPQSLRHRVHRNSAEKSVLTHAERVTGSSSHRKTSHRERAIHQRSSRSAAHAAALG